MLKWQIKTTISFQVWLTDFKIVWMSKICIDDRIASEPKLIYELI